MIYRREPAAGARSFLRRRLDSARGATAGAEGLRQRSECGRLLITKALIEIPGQFANQPPVNPEVQRKIGGAENWRGAAGLSKRPS